jgi:hypothetical protein
VQGCGARDGERRAYVAGAVADHEGGFFGGEGFGGDDEVALVLAVGRVEDDYEFIVGWVVLVGDVRGGRMDVVPNAAMTSGIESNAESAGVGLESSFA